MSITDQRAGTRATQRPSPVRRGHLARRGLDVHRHAAEAVLDLARVALTSPGRREQARDVLGARFAPHWQPRWLALHSFWQLPTAAGAPRAGSVA